MTGRKIVAFTVLLLVLIVNVREALAASTVDSPTTDDATIWSFQRKSFYANGRFWVFYCDGSNMAFKTSTDGTSWSSKTTIRSCTAADQFSIWFDGTYFHYAYCAGGSIYYRRGTPESDGTVTWSAGEQTAISGTNYLPCIAVDSNGYPWIGYHQNKRPMVAKSSKNDGTWATQFTQDLTDWDMTYAIVVPVPLTNGKMACIYTSYNQRIRLKSWSGSAWNNEWRTASADVCVYQNSGISAVAQGDTVHVVFLTGSYAIKYTSYTYDSNWSSSVTVQSSVTSTSTPVLSIDTVNNNLYCFWAGSPTADHVYYKKRVGGTWDSSPTDWINEATDHLTGNSALTCFYSSYSYKIGLVYMTKTSSPYNVRFEFLTMPVVPEYPFGPFLILLVCFFIYLIARRHYS
ncbi:MAG: hypothetical protein JTT11_09010 [Candidatus Brockarchaeota archaeon]|nr:hypothetical protein [Candidatus Brockarchaeota archaeon]